VSTLNVYSYYNAAGYRKYADFNDVVFLGAWSSTGSYYASAMQVTDYGQGQYICITDSVNRIPTTPPTKYYPTRYWSPFVIVSSGGTTPTDTTYQIAVSGSNMAVQAYGTAALALDLALIAITDSATALSQANTAISLVGDVYNIATTGTDTANQALAVAQAGTATADSAYAIAVSGSNIATAAFSIAVVGTNTANQALSVAQTGTAAANQALDELVFVLGVASYGSQTALDASDAATAAQQVANLAYSIAIDGTSAAASAQSTADAAYALAVRGTNAAETAQSTGTTALNIAVAGTTLATAAYILATAGTNAAGAAQSTADAAYALAQLGTVIPPLSTLPDVNIPAPSAQQVLLFDGSRWIAGDAPSTTSTGAFTFYLDEAPSGTLGYQTLLTVPSAGTEETDSLVITDGSGLTASTGFLSSALNRTRIDAGIWEFNIYGAVDTGSANLVVAMLTVSLDGTATELFRSALDPFTTPSPLLTSVISTQGSFAIQPTDKLLAQFYGTTSSVTPVTLSFYHNGSEHYSHIHTPLVTSHNDLAGLQGGSSNANQFYHTTLDQNAALTGSSGLPSASNKYVTEESLITEQGTRSSQDQNLQNQVTAASALASAGTSQADSAQSIATAAYTLATTGTGTATVAQALAQQAHVEAGTKVDLSGGVMTGNLTVPNLIAGTGTVPVSQAVSGTLYYSLTGPAYQVTTATSNFQVSVTNLTNGAETCAVIVSDGTQRAITYDSTFSWFGTQTPYTSTTSGKKILVALSCILSPSTGTYVLGATSPQI